MAACLNGTVLTTTSRLTVLLLLKDGSTEQPGPNLSQRGVQRPGSVRPHARPLLGRVSAFPPSRLAGPSVGVICSMLCHLGALVASACPRHMHIIAAWSFRTPAPMAKGSRQDWYCAPLLQVLSNTMTMRPKKTVKLDPQDLFMSWVQLAMEHSVRFNSVRNRELSRGMSHCSSRRVRTVARSNSMHALVRRISVPEKRLK
jgi:hypothetical protein